MWFVRQRQSGNTTRSKMQMKRAVDERLKRSIDAGGIRKEWPMWQSMTRAWRIVRVACMDTEVPAGTDEKKMGRTFAAVFKS